ncbi:GDSL-type esterase/lipase family protein [Flavobacterium sp. H122]|uniref:GDSL-type esterase/lipase family protein n=1 Tax=Flavobacterium sp. H122 TaxID=2529860 RepID=UPI0010AAB3E6|nr:GDSL-type esterase/lipase family protein [Flavobacterium sp. H122]
MKKIVLLFLLILSSKSGFGQHIAYDTIRYAKEYYEQRVKLFNSEPVVKGRTIFLGDSITEFGNWPQLTNDSTAVNRGIAGDNTFGVLERLEDVIKREPKKLFVLIGINDISQNIPIDVVIENIHRIIGKMQDYSPTTEIYLESVLPTNDVVKNFYPDAYGKNDIVDQFNERLKEQARKHHITYIDIHSVFENKKGQLTVKYSDKDGLHLNDLGYTTWIDFLKSMNCL